MTDGVGQVLLNLGKKILIFVKTFGHVRIFLYLCIQKIKVMEDYRIFLGFIVGTLLFAIVMIGLELITDAYEDRKKKKNNNN